MTNTTLFLVVLAVALTIVVGRATHLALAGARARRRTARELDRAAWRLWMSRS